MSHSDSSKDTYKNHAFLDQIGQTDYHKTTANGGTSTVTTKGEIVQSDDPSTRPDASLAQKLTGDFEGAISGTVGGLQAATGAAIRNKNMEEKGLEKMEKEDERLGAKRGVMPVGSDRREGREDVQGNVGAEEGQRA